MTITHISARGFIPPDERYSTLVIRAKLSDGRALEVPITWSYMDISSQHNVRQVSALFQSLFENGLASLMDVLEEQQ